MSDDNAWVPIAVGAGSVVGTAVAFWSGFRSVRRKRLIENVPTSKVAGVFVGLTEVKGEAEDDTYRVSYLAGVECVWYRYSVEEEWRKTETYTDDKGNTRTRTESGWTTVDSGDVRAPFFLRDDTGRLRILPEGAEIEGTEVLSRTCTSFDPLYYGKGPRTAISYSTGVRRFQEWAIRPGARLYVMGTARLRDEAIAPEIARDDEAEMFLISVRSEEEIVRSYGIFGPIKIAAGMLLANVAPPAFVWRTPGDTVGAAAGRAWPFMLGASTLYALAILVDYLFIVYNGLVDVRNRAARAWSEIDVQLKRRHDLIPNLCACVKGYAGHGREVTETLAKTRVEAASGSGGRLARGLPIGGAALGAVGLANAQTLALGGLYGLIERYPAVKADRRFGKLMDELTRTEERIALARTFYNESVTSLNNRLTTLPDALLVGFGGFKKADYFKIEEFEERPVSVALDAPREEPPKIEANRPAGGEATGALKGKPAAEKAPRQGR